MGTFGGLGGGAGAVSFEIRGVAMKLAVSELGARRRRWGAAKMAQLQSVLMTSFSLVFLLSQV